MPLDGLIFDMDGTLLDTNAAHVDAWVEGLAAHGFPIPAGRIRPEIGKGGDQLLPTLLGDDLADADEEAIRAGVGKAFRRIAGERRFRLFDGAAELLETLRARGLRLALATSAGEEDLEAIMKSAGVDLRDRFDAVVTKSDVEASKPEPDVVQAACAKLGLSPAQCAMVGDTPFDATSARRAGVVTLGVECGGLLDEPTSRERLLRAGARATWQDVAHLARDLDEALRIAAPATVRLTAEVLAALMREAIGQARDALAWGEAPIGSVLADGNGRVRARAFNEVMRTGSRLLHAEVVAMRRAAGAVPMDASDLILVSTVEPCVMCTGAAMVAAVDTIVYGLRAPANGGSERVEPPRDPASRMPRIVGGVLARESRALIDEWMQEVKDDEQARFGRQLLDETDESGRDRSRS
jgi:HAD superfamily hydrolase (TIGR01509 family)